MANFHNAPRPVDDPEHPRRENEPRDEIEMFIRDAYAAGCAAARNPGGALVAFEYANIHAPKLRALLTPSPDHADAGKDEGDGWLPIDSAPKDGTAILAYQAGRYFKCWMECDQYEGGYFWQDEEDSEPSPTHWRPLPSAPSGGDRHGE